ncbi:hypothetical protein D9613_006159 [Agrocybe pediades]|uniref:Alpha/beta-hydrolase n=1 Tax=Agrocybe pediades TaxID=84607 RepID=A0A8H4VPC8_9AGAR|nr:hypothetical protein D9613_006159 [Agrocybe pediades]
MDDLQNLITIQYKTHGSNIPMYYDIHLPSSLSEESEARKVEVPAIPAVVYFHGGGLSVGNRRSWTPIWLKKRVLDLGYAYISPDYRLLPPATAFDIVEDLQDLFKHISNTTFNGRSQAFRIDMDRIAVAGSSAGGTCAYLAATHCLPKPKALVSMYGMGGNFLISHYLRQKHTVFFRGRDLLDPAEFKEYLYPFSEGPLPSIADSPLAYHPQTYHIPGYPANKRMLLPRLYLQLGTFLDYYTGIHDPSISSKLLAIFESGPSDDEEYAHALPSDRYRAIFPQLSVTSAWPETMLLHGIQDTAVPVEESRKMKDVLTKAAVQVDLLEFADSEHSFDYEPGAKERWNKEFDQVKDFLRTRLS